jgi:cell division protein FtsX
MGPLWLVTFLRPNDTIAGEAEVRASDQAVPRSEAMAGIIFAVAIALATILCVGVVIWASDY